LNSRRALLGGKVKISFCPECRSGELPPASFLDLYKQRLRWALGWDQVTLQHMKSIPGAPLRCAEKFGLYYILPLRWGLLFSATLNALIAPLVASTYLNHVEGGELGKPIEMCQAFSFTAFAAVCVIVVLNAVVHEPWHRWPAILFFQMSGLVYIGWQLLLVFISLSKICRGADGGWVVTSRAAGISVPRRGGKPGTDLPSPAPLPPPGAAIPATAASAKASSLGPRRIRSVPLVGCSPISAAFAGDVCRQDASTVQGEDATAANKALV